MFDKKPKQDEKPAAGAAAAPAAEAAPKFEEIDLDIPSVSWEKTEEITGKIIDTDVFESERGRKRVFIVVIAGEPTRLIEQAGLRRLFEKAKVGDSIKVKAEGWRQLEGNNEMRVFKASIAPGPIQRTARESQAEEMRDGRPSRQAKR